MPSMRGGDTFTAATWHLTTLDPTTRRGAPSCGYKRAKGSNPSPSSRQNHYDESMGTELSAVPYLRVSTDDKGQDPERQMLRIRSWAESETVHLLPAVRDEGTSALKVDPFQRETFREAINAAKAAKAGAIVVEEPDRFSRKGSTRYGYYKTKLLMDYGLRLLVADRRLEDQDSAMGELMESVKAAQGRTFSENLSRRIKEGQAKMRARGQHIGRPAKGITANERSLVAKMREEGHGWDSISKAVCQARGVFDYATPEVRRRKGISGTAIRRAFNQNLPTRQNHSPMEGPQ